MSAFQADKDFAAHVNALIPTLSRPEALGFPCCPALRVWDSHAVPP